MSWTSAFGGGVESISFSAWTAGGAQGLIVTGVVSDPEMGIEPETGAEAEVVHPAVAGQSQMDRALNKN